nr:hypothetical protein [Nannocystis sp.]
MTQAGVLDAGDARVGVGAIGAHADLRADQRDGRTARVLQRHRQQRGADVLAGAGELIQLALVVAITGPLAGQVRAARRVRRGLLRPLERGELVGQSDQSVGLAGHRRDDDDDLVPRPLGRQHPLGAASDPLQAPHRGATVFLHDQHDIAPTPARRCCTASAAPLSSSS